LGGQTLARLPKNSHQEIMSDEEARIASMEQLLFAVRNSNKASTPEQKGRWSQNAGDTLLKKRSDQGVGGGNPKKISSLA